MTIAQSQRRQSRAELGNEDEIIDAQLPQPETPAVNVRSRKASHYLGLFKENEGSSSRQPHVTHKLQDLLNQKQQAGDDTPTNHLPKDRGEEPSQEETDDTQRMPMDLLEEIRNHHHLAPGKARRISYSKAVPGHDGERLGHMDRSRKATDEEDSDREHISSATYFPHQGVALGDSPIDESQQEARKARAQASRPKEDQQQTADDNSSSFRAEDGGARSDGKFSLTRAPSHRSVDGRAMSGQTEENGFSDSEYESGYSTSGSVSQASEDEETTPTATPTAFCECEMIRG